MKKYFYMAAIAAAVVAVAPSRATAQVKLVAYWDFEKIESDGVTIKSVVGAHAGAISGDAILTDAASGRPGGGKGFDVGAANPGWLQVDNGDAPNEAAADDKMSVVLWQKNYSNINSSSFWGHSDSAGGGRGFQFHIPWSDGTIYFDTQGCCGATTRLNKGGSGFDSWHHYAFIKEGDTKRIYIDGELFAEASGYDPLTPDYSKYTVGGADNASPPDAIIDDFAIFKGALSVDDLKALAGGSRPDTFQKDTDGDGLPDDWETKYGFNPNSAADKNADPDKDGCDNLCEYANGTDPNDTTAPTLGSAATTPSFDTVTLTFSEKIDPTTGATAANYTLSPALAVTAATVKAGKVTLTTAKQAPGQLYTVTVSNVTDLSKNKVAVGTSASFYSYILITDGVLKFSYYDNITGNLTQSMYDDARYGTAPTLVAAASSLNSRSVFPDDSHEAYGATLEGLFSPPEDGDYDFFMGSDDNGDLWLSTDDKPDNATVIASESGCCNGFLEPGANQTTASPIKLLKSKKYFLRLAYKEGGGGDWGQAAFRKTTDTTPAGSLQPIPGKYFTSVTPVPSDPQGKFMGISPAVGAKGVLPNTKLLITHFDGKIPLTPANTSLKFNGAVVPAVITKDGNILSVSYDPATMLASGSVNSVILSYPDAGGNPTTLDYTFTVLAYSGPTKDKIGAYPGLIAAPASYTADKGGKSGKAGDYALDHTAKGGNVLVLDASWVNSATAADELSVTFWQKKYNTADSSAFWFISPTAGGQRAYQAHVPWSNGHVYFDSAGCCNADQRMESDIINLTSYSGDPTWWLDWHHYAFVKKADVKQIWIDGELFLEASGAAVLPTDITALNIGSDNAGGGLNHAVVDDFAVFKKQLTEANLKALTAGTLPNALPAATGLIAYWDFNDAGVVAVTPTIGITASAITFTGVLQVSDTVSGPYVDVAGATSPRDITGTVSTKFWRTRAP